MYAKHSQVNQTHLDPKRRIQLATLLRRHDAGLTLRDITVKTGLTSASLAISLGALRAEGSVDVVEPDRWRWTGGPLLVGWRDLNARRRRIVEFVARAGREVSSRDVAEAVGFSRETVAKELAALASAGWVESREGVLDKRRCLFVTISKSGTDAFYAANAVEISTDKPAA